MTNDEHNKDPNVKQPGEKPEGAQHYNPGNQSGKSQSIPPDRQEDKELRQERPTQR
jgi:hypothetical protein